MRKVNMAAFSVFGVSAVASYMAIAMAHSTPVYASITWHQDSTLPGLANKAGCARQIAVGPNNFPWVIGCGTPDGKNFEVYVLEYNNWIPNQYQWVDTGGAGVAITVDANNNAWLLTSDGHIWGGPDISLVGSPVQRWSDWTNLMGGGGTVYDCNTDKSP